MLNKIKQKKNYKYLLGLFFGLIVSAGIAYAVTGNSGYFGTADDLSYDSSSNWLTAVTVQGALDQLYSQKNCPIRSTCVKKKNYLSLGDYILYYPNKTVVYTDPDKTGYGSQQEFNPSELTLWRVININDDGTTDIISQYVSSASIYFKSRTAYYNYVGVLNELASQYENSTYSSSSRYFGYNGQEEYFPLSTPINNTTMPDSLYTRDYNMVKNTLGTAAAKIRNGLTASEYWIAGRGDVNTGNYVRLRYINTSGNVADGYSIERGETPGSHLRPIVTLRAGLSYLGLGTEDYPMEILTN